MTRIGEKVLHMGYRNETGVGLWWA